MIKEIALQQTSVPDFSYVYPPLFRGDAAAKIWPRGQLLAFQRRRIVARSAYVLKALGVTSEWGLCGMHPGQNGGQNPTETSVTEFISLESLEELKNIKIILFLIQELVSQIPLKSLNKSLFNQLGSHASHDRGIQGYTRVYRGIQGSSTSSNSSTSSKSSTSNFEVKHLKLVKHLKWGPVRGFSRF